MLAVSQTFLNAEISDIAQIAYQVFLVRGNYADANLGAVASSSGDDASGSYPASGAIFGNRVMPSGTANYGGDHTEINMGSSSQADNGIGLESWRSSATPTIGSPVNLAVNLGKVRTFNYIKLYNYSGDPLTSYVLQYSDNGSSWTTFAGTPDQGSGTGFTGYTGGLDIYDFSAAGTTFSHQYIRCLIYGTKNSDAANIIKLEVYYKQDVSSRLTSLEVSRQRDWKQVNPMAAQVKLAFNNSDRFFSPSHVPTSAEATAGYFNTELDEDLGIVVNLGFYYPGTPYYGYGGWGSGVWGGPPAWGADSTLSLPNSNPELATVFVGTIDEIKVNSRTALCEINGRDGLKDVINETYSTRLKYNQDIGSLVQYCLNICGVSNYEMSVQMTGIYEPYFFVYENSMFTTIQQLCQAAGNAQCWFDEGGKANFSGALVQSANSRTDLVWPAINMGAFAGTAPGSGTITQNGQSIALADPSGNVSAWYNVEIFDANGGHAPSGWQFSAQIQGPSNALSYVFFAISSNPGLSLPTGYGLSIGASGGISLVRCDSSTVTTIASANISSIADVTKTPVPFTVIRAVNARGQVFWNVWAAGQLIIHNPIDGTYSGLYPYIGAYVLWPGVTFTVANIAVLNQLYTTSINVSQITLFSTITITSEVIDQGVGVQAEGNLSVGYAPANANITFATRTSPDGASWSPFTAVTLSSTQQGSIPSPAQRDFQYEFQFLVGGSQYQTLYTISYVRATWTPAASTSPSTSVRTLSYDATICDLEQDISGNLGGDSSIINYVEVIASPLVLTGNITDVQWQCPAGFPAAVVSATNPLIVVAGTTKIQAVIQGGMDISGMVTTPAHPTTPQAIQITWGTARGSVSVSYIHPTKPVITLTIAQPGTITQLNLIGQAFGSGQLPIDITAGNSASQSKHKRRVSQITNNFITIQAIAQLIANQQLTQFATPANILSGLTVPLLPSIQQTDLLAVTDYLLDLSPAQIWKTTGIKHAVSVSGSSAKAATTLTALLS